MHEGKKHTEAIARSMGTKYCTNCRLTRSAGGGKNIIYKDGLRFRWICQGCVDSERKRFVQKQKAIGKAA